MLQGNLAKGRQGNEDTPGVQVDPSSVSTVTMTLGLPLFRTTSTPPPSLLIASPGIGRLVKCPGQSGWDPFGRHDMGIMRLRRVTATR